MRLLSSKQCTCVKSSAKLSILGDLILSDDSLSSRVPSDAYKPEGLLGKFYDILAKSDVVFANLEGVLSMRGEPIAKPLPPCFFLRADPSEVKLLRSLGGIVLTLANNHIADYGFVAMEDTLVTLEQNNILYLGIGRNAEDAHTPRVIELSGVRVAALAFTDMLPRHFYAEHSRTGAAELSVENLREGIRRARTSADFVIVFLHTVLPSYPAFSFFPDKHQRFFSRIAVDLGADLVIGQQPHGLQLVERYRDKLIFYSLGAFLYDPDLPRTFSRGHPLFQATQIYGGALLTLRLCTHGVYDFDLLPSKVARDVKGRLIVVDNTFFVRRLAKINQWLVG